MGNPTGIILTSVSLQDAGSISYNTSQRFTVTGSVVKDATTLSLTGSVWSAIPTGSFTKGVQYINLGNVTTSSLINISINNTSSIFATLKYLDGITLPPPTASAYWAKPVSFGPFTGSQATASLFVVSIEN